MPAKSGIEYLGLSRVQGPLVFVNGVRNVGFREMAELVAADGRTRLGRVLAVSEDMAVIEVFEGTVGLSTSRSKVRFLGRPFQYAGTAGDVLGRVFNGLGSPLDGGSPPMAGKARDINGLPINPVARVYPQDFIETGLAVLIVFIVFRREFDSVLDGIIYAGVAALGFAASENTYYIYNYGYAENGWSGLLFLTFIRVILVGSTRSTRPSPASHWQLHA